MKRFCALLLVGLFLIALDARPLSAQPDTTRWTSELTMQCDQITHTEISPDGKHVAYVIQEAVMNKTTSTFRRHMHVVAVGGSLARLSTCVS